MPQLPEALICYLVQQLFSIRRLRHLKLREQSLVGGRIEARIDELLYVRGLQTVFVPPRQSSTYAAMKVRTAGNDFSAMNDLRRRIWKIEERWIAVRGNSYDAPPFTAWSKAALACST